MANHPDIGLRDAEEAGNIGAGLLVIESHHDNRALTFFEILHALGELAVIELRSGRLRGRKEIGPELFEQTLFSLSAPAHPEHGQTANAEHEGSQLFPLPQAAGSQRFQSGDENLLCQVVGGLFVSQVAQSVEPEAGCHAPE